MKKSVLKFLITTLLTTTVLAAPYQGMVKIDGGLFTPFFDKDKDGERQLL